MKTIAKSVNFIKSNKKTVGIFLFVACCMSTGMPPCMTFAYQVSSYALALLTYVCSYLALKALDEECESEEKIKLITIALLGLITTLNITVPYFVVEIVGLIK